LGLRRNPVFFVVRENLDKNQIAPYPDAFESIRADFLKGEHFTIKIILISEIDYENQVVGETGLEPVTSCV
jgi:hypothetical protein